MADNLTVAQASALAHVTVLATGEPLDPTLRVTINFHPDRLAAGVPLLDAIARDGVYRSQFETGTSNGGLTARRGGDRWHWESRMFGRAYDVAPATERPRYGALDHARSPVGAAPRFGSAHLRLTADTLARTTFCYPDSVRRPTRFGVADRMSLISLVEAADGDPLDAYVEAHVHGPVRPAADVEAIVLDPCFRGSEVERAAHRLGCAVEWHEGFRLSRRELARHSDYRGREYVELGRALAVDGHLDPRILGAASRSRDHDDRALKRVWHLLARFGVTR